MKFLHVVVRVIQYYWFVIFLIVFPPSRDTTTTITVTALVHRYRLDVGSSSRRRGHCCNRILPQHQHSSFKSTLSSSISLLASRTIPNYTSQSLKAAVDAEQQTSSLSSSSSSSSQFRYWQSNFASICCLVGALVLGSLQLLQPLPVHAAAANNDDIISTATTSINIGRDSIAPCNKLVASDKNVKNCVSTASVRQLDLYASPWTFSSSLTNTQVLEYLQHALKETDRLIEIVPVDNDSSDDGLRAVTTRALAKDQLDFYINRNDRVIQFVSRQVDGPDVSDLGGNRKRLEQVRKRTPFGIMGVNVDDEEYNDQNKREGALGQLKAFYGLQSGSGFEDVLLNDDD